MLTWGDLCNLLVRKAQVWVAIDGKVVKFPIRTVQRIQNTDGGDFWRLYIDTKGYEITKKED